MEQINATEEYKKATDEYITNMREHIDSLEAELKKVNEQMHMDDQYHADSLRSFTWGLVRGANEKMTSIGGRYERRVSNLRNIVVRSENPDERFIEGEGL